MNAKKTLSLVVFSLILTGILPLSGMLTTVNQVKAQVEIPTPREETLILVRPNFDIFDRWNPFIPNGLACGDGFNILMSEYLWHINYATGEVIYWLIKGWEYSDDFKTFILHVRDGVTWNDGEPFTAKDIKFTFEMVKGNDKLYWHSWAEEWIESVETPDDLTVVVHLKKPNPRFHYNFRGWTIHIVPEHIWKDVDPVTFKNDPPVTTGPYKLYKVIPESKMFVFIRNENYWAKKLGYFPEPKYVIIRAMLAADVEYVNWLNGMFDAGVGLDFMPIDLVKSGLEKGANTSLCPFFDPCPRGLWVNCQKYPLNIPEVRWAISYCVNREKLALVWPSVTPSVPAKYPWADWKGLRKFAYPEVFEKYKLEYDLDKAAEILDNLDFKDRDGDGIRETPNGTVLSWELISWGGPQEVEALDIAENLKKIGIDVEVKVPTGTVMDEKQATGQFDLALLCLCTGMPWNNDAYYLLSGFHSKYNAPIGVRQMSGQWCRLSDPELDAVIDELGMVSPDDPKADELYKRGIELWMRDLPAIPIVETIYELCWSTKYWTGWPTQDNFHSWPANWWPEFKFVIFKLKSTGARPAIEYAYVWITKDIEAFTGVDKRTYGPFSEGDYVNIPKEDADRLVAEGAASYTPPGAPAAEELKNMISALTADVRELKGTVGELAGISESIISISSQMSMLTTGVAIEGIVIIILAIALVLAMRRK